MCFGTTCSKHRLSIVLFLAGTSWASISGQQVIQRGAFGKPAQVLDETKQWTAPLLVGTEKDVEIYIPDLSNPDWLKLNYRDYFDRGYYTITLFTFYRTPAACRRNQIGWGLGDKAHLDACTDIRYRVRTAKMVPQEKSITLLSAAMVLENGEIDQTTIETRQAFRFGISWTRIPSPPSKRPTILSAFR
ncbi:hypothetical protein AciPR4_2059 [Terriglobus saanensis SP1PR4]|uniref:Uncharacterized protein n=1 Tax=Terriglobus saanensis (strain ATCC BAA-1853 / DSM 23119 / SP1PR4) TaxID=401053 RepID=E8V7T9_TERSS|nr:hypothetical protein AciPR4_2059 [Terriglobus saanensis SP1PR4]